jgi:hypothetical protein
MWPIEGSNVDEAVVENELQVFLMGLDGEDLEEIVLLEAQGQIENAVEGQTNRRFLHIALNIIILQMRKTMLQNIQIIKNPQ